jgi:hypothetical protein
VIAATFGATASAACIDPIPMAKRLLPGAAVDRTPSYSSPSAMAAAAGDASSDSSASIVGLWHITFVSNGNNVAPFFIPDGAMLDDGYAQWHSDSTEIMNSGRDPATSNFCLGVWKSAGGHTYKLNHFALSWDNTGALCTPQAGATSCFVGPTNIRQEVTVDRHGRTYSGTVTIDQYDNAGNVLFQLAGLVSAERITAN